MTSLYDQLQQHSYTFGSPSPPSPPMDPAFTFAGTATDTSPPSSGLGSSLRKLDRGNGDGGAASRQKSCNACVRGKRRCDKRTPRCTRCAAKGLDCVYQRQPPPSSASSALPLQTQTQTQQQQQQQRSQPQPAQRQRLSSQHQQQQQHQHSSPPIACSSTAATASSCASAVDGSCSTPEMPPEFDMSFDIESLSTATGTNTSPESLQQDGNLHLGGEPQAHHHHQHHHHNPQQHTPDLSFIVDLMTAADDSGPGSLWDLTGFGVGSKMDLPPVPIVPPLQTPTQTQTQQPMSSQEQQQQQQQQQ
ncbi:hypothetical protein BBK36DRAFT_122468, partial [Trichoderma citrinoviride]